MHVGIFFFMQSTNFFFESEFFIKNLLFVGSEKGFGAFHLV